MRKRGDSYLSRTTSADIVPYENELFGVYFVETKTETSKHQYDCFDTASDLLMNGDYLLQVAGNFHFAPGKSFQQSHVHGKVFSPPPGCDLQLPSVPDCSLGVSLHCCP